LNRDRDLTSLASTSGIDIYTNYAILWQPSAAVSPNHCYIDGAGVDVANDICRID